jgi:hypothetical protein
MRQRFSSQELFTLRNHIPIDILIEKVLMVPSKFSEGFFRFRCPLCGAFNTATNCDTNLARCFYCNKNFNTIEMVMAIRKTDFVESVKFLKHCHKALTKNRGDRPVTAAGNASRDDLLSSVLQDTDENINVFDSNTQRRPCEKPVPIGAVLDKTLLHLPRKHHQNQRKLLPPPPPETASPKAYPSSPIIKRIEGLEQQMESLFEQLQYLNAVIGIQNRSL